MRAHKTFFLFFLLMTFPVRLDAQTLEARLLERIEALEKLVGHLKERVVELESRLAGQGSSRRDSSSEGPSTRDAAPSGEPTPAPGTSTRRPLSAQWTDRLRFQSPDEQFRFDVGMQFQNDWAFLSEDRSLVESFGPLPNGTEFRRTRLSLSGLLYDRFDFKTQFDFAGGDSSFRDAFVGFRSVGGITNIRVGQFKEPFSLEELTSSKYVSFLERSLPNVFAPSRNTGLMVHDTLFGDRFTYAAGIFRDSDDFGDAPGDGNFAETVRFTGLPYFTDSGARLVHLGVGYSHRSPRNDVLRHAQRPEAHLAPRFVDTGAIAADSEDRVALEAAVVHGPFSIQSEYIRSSVDRLGASGLSFDSFYVSASLFVTGEYRRYSRSDGAFGRVIPRRSLIEEGQGLGAWELLGRFSYLDLEDRDIRGGILRDFTLGLNWYLTPHSKIMWNYVFADRENLGEANILQTRFELNF